MKIVEINTMRTLLFLLLAVSLPTVTFSTHAETFDHSHSDFTALLEDVVVANNFQSRVRYSEVVSRRDELDGYLGQLAGVSRASFDKFSPDQQLSFLINTYNAYQLKQVIDHYPIESIKDVGSFFSSPWSKEFFTLFGEPASLDLVEHGLIRTLFKEPRIHFAVNCASISCPPLIYQVQAGPRHKLDFREQRRQSRQYLVEFF